MDSLRKTLAKRCQSLTESHHLDIATCPCGAPFECILSSEEKEILKNDPEIVAQREANLLLNKELQGDQC